MAVNGPRLDEFGSKFNTVVGVKKYQQTKKIMESFDTKLQQEINKQQPNKVDYKIK